MIHDCSIIPVLQSISHHDIVLVSTSFKVENQDADINDKAEPRTGFNSLNFFGDNIHWDMIKSKLKM